MCTWVRMHVYTNPWWPYLDLEVVREVRGVPWLVWGE